MKSLFEVARYWTIFDVLDANMALDLQADLEAEAYDKAKSKAERDR